MTMLNDQPLTDALKALRTFTDWTSLCRSTTKATRSILTSTPTDTFTHTNTQTQNIQADIPGQRAFTLIYTTAILITIHHFRHQQSLLFHSRVCITVNSQQQLLLLQPFYGSLDFVRDNPSETVPEETFTHSRLSWHQLTGAVPERGL